MPDDKIHSGRILVIDDEESMRHFLTRGLRRRGHSVQEACSGEEGLATLADAEVDLVLLDLKMPGRPGMEVLPEILGRPDAPRVIVMTGFGTIETAVEAMKQGASDYVTKPLSLADISRRVSRELAAARLRRENIALREALARKAASPLLGQSKVMRKLRSEIGRIAPGDSTVLITGESGTGKELAARALHEGSARAGGAFVAVNCGALPDTILESELFGYFPGAFTGAAKRKIGFFERAHGGTLFLDEIGELSQPFQVALLRVLQEREIIPLGGTDPVAVDFRLVAASNRDLESEMAEGRFREDLFYRIHVLSIAMPPLRDRVGDISLLARHFLGAQAEDNAEFTQDALDLLERHSWPGNVRELMNVVERCAALTTSPVFSAQSLPESIRTMAERPDPPPPLKDARERFEKDYFTRLLEAARGNVSKAARLADMSRPNLHGKIRDHGLDPADFKSR